MRLTCTFYRYFIRLSLLMMIVATLYSVQAVGIDVMVDKQPVPEETGIADGLFVIPNEFDTWKFAPELKDRSGTLISVGTFRSLTDAAYGDFSNVILFDYDRVVTQFNRMNLDLIAKSKNRIDYLNNVFDLGLSQKQINTILKSPEMEEELLGTEFLKRSIERRPPPWFNSLTELTRANGPSLYGKLLPQKIYEGYLQEKSHWPRWRMSYLGSDSLFKRVKSLVIQKKIHPMTGSLTGTETMLALASALKNLGTSVSAIDVSNAPFLFMFGEERSQSEVFRAHASNLKSLPMDPSAIILMTSGGEGADGWSYFSVAAADHIQTQRKLETTEEVAGFREALTHSSKKLGGTPPLNYADDKGCKATFRKLYTITRTSIAD